MGGCKCAYKSCNKNSDRKTHFFHYPVKHQERCMQWMVNSNRLDFQHLSTSQLKNKVVCQYHFEDKMFINYKHDRLVFNAIPTPEYEDYKHDFQPVKLKEHENEEFDLPSDSIFEKNNKEESMMSVVVSPITGLSFISPVEKKKKCTAPYVELLTRKHKVVSSFEPKLINVSTPMRNNTTSSTLKEKPTKTKNKNKRSSEKNDPQKIIDSNVSNERDDRVIVENKPLPVSPIRKTSIKSEFNKQERKSVEATSPEVENKPETVKPIRKIFIKNIKKQQDKTIVEVGDTSSEAENKTPCPTENKNPHTHPIEIAPTVPLGTNLNNLVHLQPTPQMKVLPSINKPRLLTAIDKSAILSRQLENAPRKEHNHIKIIDVRSVKLPLQSQSVEIQTGENTNQIEAFMKLLQENTKEISELKKKVFEQESKPPASSKRTAEVIDLDIADDTMNKALLFTRIVPYLTPRLARRVHSEMFPTIAKKRKL